jgi:hypothetical protein
MHMHILIKTRAVDLPDDISIKVPEKKYTRKLLLAKFSYVPANYTVLLGKVQYLHGVTKISKYRTAPTAAFYIGTI